MFFNLALTFYLQAILSHFPNCFQYVLVIVLGYFSRFPVVSLTFEAKIYYNKKQASTVARTVFYLGRENESCRNSAINAKNCLQKVGIIFIVYLRQHLWNGQLFREW